MERLLLYIIEVIVAQDECEIVRTESGSNGAQWLIKVGSHCLFILDKYDLNAIRGYIEDNPLCVDEIGRDRFSYLFTSTLETL